MGEDEVKNGTLNIKKSSEKEQKTIKQDELIETIHAWEGK
jgi:histidyl-tRNA synthetase